MTAVRIEPRPPTDPGLAALIAAAEAEIVARYGADGIYPLDPSAAYLVAYVEPAAVGCGALARLEPGTAEIKRMYVDPAWRGRGVARRILGALEERAVAQGYGAVRLETGIRQPESIRLYETAGYVRTPAFGQYVGDPLSVCFVKHFPGPG